jgi:hypothetical protein
LQRQRLQVVAPPGNVKRQSIKRKCILKNVGMQNAKNIQDAEDKNRDNGVNKIPQSIRKRDNRSAIY